MFGIKVTISNCRHPGMWIQQNSYVRTKEKCTRAHLPEPPEYVSDSGITKKKGTIFKKKKSHITIQSIYAANENLKKKTLILTQVLRNKGKTFWGTGSLFLEEKMRRFSYTRARI